MRNIELSLSGEYLTLREAYRRVVVMWVAFINVGLYGPPTALFPFTCLLRGSYSRTHRVSTPLGEFLKSVSQVVNNCKLGEKKNVNVPGYLPTLSIRSPELGT